MFQLLQPGTTTAHGSYPDTPSYCDGLLRSRRSCVLLIDSFRVPFNLKETKTTTFVLPN